MVQSLLLLSGCQDAGPAGPTAPRPSQPALATPAQPTATAALQPTSAPSFPVVLDEARWQVLYRRPGWDGRASADLRAVGDIMLGRGVGETAARQGLRYPFEPVAPLLQGGSTLGNLEGPLTERTTLRPGPYRLPADPAFAPVLYELGFRALSLANNHALDAGPEGLGDSIAALRGARIQPLGAGRGSSAAGQHVLLPDLPLRIALLAFNDVKDPEDQPDESSDWGRAWLDDQALEQVASARAQAELVVVLVHWGEEYAAQPSQRQRSWARQLLDAGADVIIGAHPHVLQPIEQVSVELGNGGAPRTGLVAYSLGNFIFDQGFSAQTSQGAVLRLLIDQQGLALLALAPVEISQAQARPLPLDSAAARAIVEQLWPPASRATLALEAWSWDGSQARQVTLPPGSKPQPRPAELAVDLRGDGQPLYASLNQQGLVQLRDGQAPEAEIVWRNEEPDWRVLRIDAGDPNDDGRIELLLLLWKPRSSTAGKGDQARLGSHPFLVGWRGGRYRVIWGGSATRTPIQDLATADLNGDGRNELVVLEGGSQPGDPAEHLTVWGWHGWGFELLWRSERGRWEQLALQDVGGDGLPEIVLSHGPA